MRTSVFLGTAVGILLFAGAASAAKKTYVGELSPDNETPPPDKPVVLDGHDPFGAIRATFDDETNRLCGEVEFEDMTGPLTGNHLHQAPDNAAKGDGKDLPKIVLPTTVTEANGKSTFKFNVELNAELRAKLAKTNPNDFDVTWIYINLHTAKNPGGELRSNLYLAPGQQEVVCPPPTPVGGGDAGAGDAGGDGGGSSSSSSGSASGSSSSSSGSSDPDPAPSEDAPKDDGEAKAKPKAEEGGCSTTGGEASLSLAFALGLGLVVAMRGRRRGGPRR